MEFKEVAHLYLGCLAKATYVTKDGDTDKDVPVELKNYRRLESVGIAGDRRILMWVGGNLSASQHKPILRPLSDMTEEEAYSLIFSVDFYKRHEIEVTNISDNPWIGISFTVRYDGKGRWWNKTQRLNADFNPKQVGYLLSKHFDLFGLIQSGEAIDATTLNPNPYA